MHKVFDETPHLTISLLNPMLKSYGRENRWEDTLYLFHNMIFESKSNDEKLNNFTTLIALTACARLMYSHMKIICMKKHDEVALNVFVCMRWLNCILNAEKRARLWKCLTSFHNRMCFYGAQQKEVRNFYPFIFQPSQFMALPFMVNIRYSYHFKLKNRYTHTSFASTGRMIS